MEERSGMPTMKFVIIFVFLWILLRNSSFADDSPLQKVNIPVPVPSLVFSWLDDKSTFQAGDIATIKIKLLENPSNTLRNSINISLSVNGKNGNSTYISGVYSNTEEDPTLWNITFIPLMAGDFNLVVTEILSGMIDSSLHFSVKPGFMYASACTASWTDYSNIEAGTKASLIILLNDAFGNNITRENSGQNDTYFNLSLSYENGSTVPLQDFKNNGWNNEGYISLDFILNISGNFLVHVYIEKIELRDSPLPLIVKPGPFYTSKSTAIWKYGTNSIRIFSKLEILIYQRDQFGNPVQGLHPFDARIVKKSSNLSLPVTDITFREEDEKEGTQLLSFTVSQEGLFILTVFNADMNASVSHMVYEYSVFIGYCDGSKSFANGSGLGSSVSGRVSSFTVFLMDEYNNSSPVKMERLHVQVLSSLDGSFIRPILFPLRNLSEKAPPANSPAQYNPKPPGNEDETMMGNPETSVSDYSISYLPQKSGEYEIRVFCANVPINNGQPYLMKVSPGNVIISKSKIIKYETHVKQSAKSEILVQLLDASKNEAISSESKLSYQIDTKNISNFVKFPFSEKESGIYLGYYLAKEVGSYNICVLFMEKPLSPCPFTIEVHKDEYFAIAKDDEISVWEDESISINVLQNDYLPGGRANLTDFSLAMHGSLLRYGDLFRYTPYKEYYGNDSFNYTIFDSNNNIAIGKVFVYVLCKPPQFVSLPAQQFRLTEEDTFSPKFSGFGGIKMIYSDKKGNISVTIRAQYGTIYLAPISMQFLEPSGSILAVSRGGDTGEDLELTGQLETINSALQSLQYLGNEKFYGNDVITLDAQNENGLQDLHFSVFVEAVNDAPIINSPISIFIGGKEFNDGFLIFDEQIDKFDFSIDDPDIFNFPGNKSDFLLVFALEVEEGELLTTLPVDIIGSAEIKSATRKVWQPVQTYVTISNHFVLKGKGIRFRGSLVDCNYALRNLFYLGEIDETILTISANDLGNYGCYPDCVSMMSAPLSTEINVRLDKMRGRMNPTRTLLIALVIYLEVLMMVVLGGIIVFFMCRCMNDLNDTKKNSNEDASLTSPPKENFLMNFEYKNTARPFTSSSSMRQRSRKGFDQEKFGSDAVELQPIQSLRITN